MDPIRTLGRRPLLAWLALGAGRPAWAQPEAKACAVLLLHGQGGSPQAMAGLARKLQPSCATRSPEMPWSARRGSAKEPADAMQEIGRQLKELRQQGHRRILLAGVGLGANAALAYAGAGGEIEGVIALGPDDTAAAMGPLPGIAARIRQHVPLLWVVGEGDPLHAKGEVYAFAKAPPHPASRYVALKADRSALLEAAAKPMLEWAKSLE